MDDEELAADEHKAAARVFWWWTSSTRFRVASGAKRCGPLGRNNSTPVVRYDPIYNRR
jgi:hypothetical protein